MGYKLWLGTTYDDEGDLPIPKDARSDIFDNFDEIEVDDLTIRLFRFRGHFAGIGVEIFCNPNWGTKEVDLEALANKVAKIKPKLEEIFKSWGIDQELKVYSTVDYG